MERWHSWARILCEAFRPSLHHAVDLHAHNSPNPSKARFGRGAFALFSAPSDGFVGGLLQPQALAAVFTASELGALRKRFRAA